MDSIKQTSVKVLIAGLSPDTKNFYIIWIFLSMYEFWLLPSMFLDCFSAVLSQYIGRIMNRHIPVHALPEEIQKVWSCIIRV